MWLPRRGRSSPECSAGSFRIRGQNTGGKKDDMIGYLFLFVSIFSMGLMGVVSKFSEVKKCNPMASSSMLFLWAAILIFLRLLLIEGKLPRVPGFILALALPFGVIAGIAFVTFLFAIEYGQVATSWLVVSFSPIVPALASVLVYRESLQKQKGFSLLVIGVSLILLYLDKKAGETSPAHSETMTQRDEQTSKWLRLMVIVFFCAAIGAFGLKILEEAGLSGQYRDQYLFYWYLGGFLVAAAILVGKRVRIRMKEFVVGFFLGLSSLLGNLFLSLALARRVPGYIAFPVVGIGSTLVVLAAGIFFFREHLTRYGYAGVGFGIVALLLLGL
jgi:drug/metabolite transporter (DMT)-like permease